VYFRLQNCSTIDEKENKVTRASNERVQDRKRCDGDLFRMHGHFLRGESNPTHKILPKIWKEVMT
jgi:hypothetical protein